MGAGIASYLVWAYIKITSTVIIKDVTIKLDARDLLDLQESEDEIDDLKKELGLQGE